jgi:hypothetical protein
MNVANNKPYADKTEYGKGELSSFSSRSPYILRTTT